MSELDQRRRRAAYRALHRGTKEMDWLLGRYAEARLAGMEEAELAEFERLIALPDPELQGWIMTGGLAPTSELHGLVERIRAFHGLAAGGAIRT
jgi:antitoxin CptB